MSSKGQVIIPKAMRESCRWTPGTRLELINTPDGVLLKPIESEQKKSPEVGLAAIRAKVAYVGPVISVEAMQQAVLREAARSTKA